MVDPNRTKAIGAALIKHDRMDARILAQLAAAELLAEVLSEKGAFLERARKSPGGE